MKKLILATIFVTLSKWSFADTVTFPTTAQNSFLNGQVIATIINHGSFSEEYRKGQKQVILSDNIIEAGHLNGQYVLGVTGNVYQNPFKTGLDFEGTLRLNLHAIVNKYVIFTPQWKDLLSNVEYFGAVGYDFGQNRTYGWIATINLGLGFGPGAGN